MVAWGAAKGKEVAGNKLPDIERFTFNIGDNKIRLVGPILCRFVYWVLTTEGRRMPYECLSFDRATETFTDEKDPFKELDSAVFSDKPSFAYVCNVIDRNDGKMKLFDLKATVYSQIVDYAQDPEYGDPSHEETGYDLNVKKEKTGSQPQNVRYTVMPARGSSPLTEAEKGLKQFDLDNILKRDTYDEQKAKLIKNTSLFAGEVTDEFNPTENEKDLA